MSEAIKIDLPLKAIRAYCETQPIAKLSLLGVGFDRWLRPDTDLGLVVEYCSKATITYIDMARQERELGKIIGCAVDLRTPNELEITTRQQIMVEASLVFAQNS